MKVFSVRHDWGYSLNSFGFNKRMPLLACFFFVAVQDSIFLNDVNFFIFIQVSLVINYDLPNNRELYIHRIGRSGRFGRKVWCKLFSSPSSLGSV